jgi:hypothetical protein
MRTSAFGTRDLAECAFGAEFARVGSAQTVKQTDFIQPIG